MPTISSTFCMTAAAAAVAVMTSDIGAHAFTINGTLNNDEMGYRTTLTSWGPSACTERGRFFAPPRSSTQYYSYKAFFPSSTIADGWAGIQYRADGDDPKYYVTEGRFKNSLYAGYPFGNTYVLWSGSTPVQAEGDVMWSNGSLTSVAANTTTTSIHCVSYMCNNQDDCFGNGLNVSGTWPNCNCGGCAAGVSGDSCNTFTIGDSTYTIHANLTYGTPDGMRAICEESGHTLFSTTANETEWNLLQSYIPSSFRFFVDINDNETQHLWKNSNGDIVSNASTFNSPFFGVWGDFSSRQFEVASKKPVRWGSWEEGGRCVDMTGGVLQQTECKGNRYFICVPTNNAAGPLRENGSATTPLLVGTIAVLAAIVCLLL